MLEQAIRAYLQTFVRTQPVSRDEIPAAHVSVLMIDDIDDCWMRILKRDAERAAETPAPVVMAARRITEQQLTSAVEYGLVSFFYRNELDLDQLVGAITMASAGCGSHMPPDLVTHLIAGLGCRRRQRRAQSFAVLPQGRLPARELDVLRMLSEGMAAHEIARRLSYSERTIRSIIHGIVKSLGVNNRVEAVAYAIREGII